MSACDQADLTKINAKEDTDGVVGPVGVQVTGVSLPEDWLPETASFSVAAHRDHESGLWEAIIPAFSIAGQGESLDAAVQNAVELLFDYLSLSARDGLSYWESRRSLPFRAKLPIYAGVAVYAVSQVRERRRQASDRSYLRLPLHRERIAH
jgi:hypothetical protein